MNVNENMRGHSRLPYERERQHETEREREHESGLDKLDLH
jgi:hypothetical protein